MNLNALTVMAKKSVKRIVSVIIALKTALRRIMRD